MIDIIKEGDKDKQGNAVCPQCGETVLITNYWGDPPKCPKCDRFYEPQHEPTRYTS
jgi:uncharacterized protein (DUF983 family)